MRNPATHSTVAPAWSVPVSRRRWLQVTGGLSAAAGASWLPQLAACAADRRSPPVLHPAVDERRSVAH